MNASHTPKWTLDTMTGALFRAGEQSGTTITSGYGIAHELLGDANMISTLLAQRDALRAACLAVVTAWESGDLAAAARQCEAALNSKD